MNLDKTVWHYLHANPAEFLACISAAGFAESAEFQCHFKELFKALAPFQDGQHIKSVIDYIIGNGALQQVSTTQIANCTLFNFVESTSARQLLQLVSGNTFFHLEVLLVAAAILEMEIINSRQLDALHTFAHHCLEIKICNLSL